MRATSVPRAWRTSLLTAVAAALLATAGAAQQPRGAVGAPGKAASDTCTACHAALDDARLAGPAKAAEQDVHHRQGLTCAACHGGDPSAEDGDAAMDRHRGFRGVPAAIDIPALCGSCHSDAQRMLRYAPNIPTDQLEQYRTSKHGLALAKGDATVATCASCHGAHGVVAASDARSPVYPTRIVDTCAHCHADRALMKGHGIAGDEVAEYKTSVHFDALTQKNDLSAPTCKSCHGAHGATPPGVSSVSNVCGTCHASQREAFDASPHKDAFAALEKPACESCHGNHRIVHPADTWLGVGGSQVCGSCHAAGDDGAKAAQAMAGELAAASGRVESVHARVGRAARAGMLMDEAEVKLEEAHQALVLARVDIHTVDQGAVRSRAATVMGAAAAADAQAAAAEGEIRFRRTGLFVSLVVIALAMVALILKVRSLERA